MSLKPAVLASFLGLLVIGIAGLEAQAQVTQEKQLLNSERILQKFGSYGVEIIEQRDGIRQANLYSEDESGRTTRTFATVQFAEQLPEAFTSIHNQILQGASIGSTFKAAGWEVAKTSLQFDELSLSNTQSTIALNMRLSEPTTLSLHIYEFSVHRDSESAQSYALIAEVHHPDYLSPKDLEELYSIDQLQESDSVAMEQLKARILNMLK